MLYKVYFLKVLILLLDTSNIELNDVSIEATSQILPAMRKRYIKAFEQKYDLIKK